MTRILCTACNRTEEPGLIVETARLVRRRFLDRAAWNASRRRLAIEWLD